MVSIVGAADEQFIEYLRIYVLVHLSSVAVLTPFDVLFDQICRGQYADNDQKFKVKLCGAPCAEPCCWMGSMICYPCAQYKLRYMVGFDCCFTTASYYFCLIPHDVIFLLQK